MKLDNISVKNPPPPLSLPPQSVEEGNFKKYQFSAKIVAYVDWTLLAFSVVGLFILIGFVTIAIQEESKEYHFFMEKTQETFPAVQHTEEEEGSLDNEKNAENRQRIANYFGFIFFAIVAVVIMLQAYLNYILWDAVKKGIAGNVSTWILLSTVQLVLVGLSFFQTIGGINLAANISQIVWFFYRGITIRIVWQYKKEAELNELAMCKGSGFQYA